MLVNKKMAAQKRRAQTVNDDPNQFSQSDFRICTHIVTEHGCDDDDDDDDGNGQRQEGRSVGDGITLYAPR